MAMVIQIAKISKTSDQKNLERSSKIRLPNPNPMHTKLTKIPIRTTKNTGAKMNELLVAKLGNTIRTKTEIPKYKIDHTFSLIVFLLFKELSIDKLI